LPDNIENEEDGFVTEEDEMAETEQHRKTNKRVNIGNIYMYFNYLNL